MNDEMNDKMIVFDKETTDQIIKECLDRIHAKETEKIVREFETKVIPALVKLEELSKRL